MSYEEIIENARFFVNELLEGEVHILMAIPRKKYNPEIPSATDYRKVGIWRELVTKKDLEQKVRKIYALVEHYKHEVANPEDYNFYITHNPRSPHKALMQFKAYLAAYDFDQNTDRLMHFSAEWFRCLQSKAGRSRRLSFCLDVDSDDENLLLGLQKFNPLLTIKTRNGFHVLIPPQKLDAVHVPGRDELASSKLIEVGYDRLVYIGRFQSARNHSYAKSGGSE